MQINGTLPAGVIEDGANASLALELGNLIAMASSGVLGCHCVGEMDVNHSLTKATVVDILLSFRSLVFPRRLLGLLSLYWFPVNRNLCCKFVNDVA